jgi:signal transduction histidine kinase
MMPREKISLPLVIAEVCEELSTQINGRKATLHCTLPDEALMNANYSLLHAIFRNLIENSLRYAPEGVNIYLSLDQEDATHYFFTYYDSGDGVEEHHLSRLFERFYRAQEGRTRNGADIGGTGLGLSIVRNAVLFHRGAISVRNHPEAGLEFHFTLAKN